MTIAIEERYIERGYFWKGIRIRQYREIEYSKGNSILVNYLLYLQFIVQI